MFLKIESIVDYLQTNYSIDLNVFIYINIKIGMQSVERE